MESPYWEVRGWHHHTMHLLELTETLNGFGPNGMNSVMPLFSLGVGYDDEAGWQSMLPYVQSFLLYPQAVWYPFIYLTWESWTLANYQNRVEWLLLWAEDWAEFANSTTRHTRVSTLVDMAHKVGIAAGKMGYIIMRGANHPHQERMCLLQRSNNTHGEWSPTSHLWKWYATTGREGLK